MQSAYTWVLGASGFVGFELSRQLAQSKDPEHPLVTVGHKTMNPYLMEQTNHFMKSLSDLDTPFVARFSPKVVFHCARMGSRFGLGRWWAARSGARANQSLISTLSHLPQKPVVVYCSGTLMYGEQIGFADEFSPLNPTAYGKPYLAAELPWIKARDKGLLDVRMARPAWILGPSSWFYQFFVRPALEQGYVPVYGSGNQWMSLISLADCAQQLRHCFEYGLPNTDYNLYGFEPITQEAFSSILARELRLPLRSISRSMLKKAHGTTVMEALCSNIPVRSIHPEWRQHSVPHFADIDSLVVQTLNQSLARRNS